MDKNKPVDDIDEIVKMLDEMTESGVSRLKVKTSSDLEQGKTKKEYHLGRCDIGSAFACGTPFDVTDDNDRT
ncbi:MAG: hypothetical protein J5626_11295 [Lachnospiraceae bacterium]|nr:hypothetical protein [Lachnospiraceae bacterium]